MLTSPGVEKGGTSVEAVHQSKNNNEKMGLKFNLLGPCEHKLPNLLPKFPQSKVVTACECCVTVDAERTGFLILDDGLAGEETFYNAARIIKR